jgi:CDP-glycerol glycerophosphotransferase
MISYAPRGDVMPLLKRADLLVTDYSSLYTDFLHKGAPILFYPFDREEYGEAFREMQFPYDSMTPGPKAMTPLQLREGILSLLEGSDPWKERREELFSLAFTHRDGGSSRRVAELLERP